MSSKRIVLREIDRFLSSSEPEVLCISGEWGIGKTYTWQVSVDAAIKEGLFKFARYSYVSLFGINTLDALKLAIAEGSETINFNEQESAFSKIGNFIDNFSGRHRKYKKIGNEFPTIRNLIAAYDQYLFTNVRNQIIWPAAGSVDTILS